MRWKNTAIDLSGTVTEEALHHGNNDCKNISTADEKANYDASCKRFLAEKIILAWIMKSCLREYMDCDGTFPVCRAVEKTKINKTLRKEQAAIYPIILI